MEKQEKSNMWKRMEPYFTQNTNASKHIADIKLFKTEEFIKRKSRFNTQIQKIVIPLEL